MDLTDAAVKESLERVHSAIVNCAYRYPKTKSLINLAPADVKKAGPAFDLPVALGMLVGEGVLVGTPLKEFVIVGELALDGRVRPVNGVLSMAMTAAANGFCRMIVPLENAREAAVVQEARQHVLLGCGFLMPCLQSTYTRLPSNLVRFIRGAQQARHGMALA